MKVSVQDITKEQLQRFHSLERENKALLKVISHDIKSPFNKLYALINLLEMTDDPVSEEQQNLLDNMAIVVREGMDLINNLLDLRALEEFDIKPKRRTLELTGLLKKSISGMKVMAKRKWIRFLLDVNEVEIFSDAHYLSRIFDHLISNAIKYGKRQSTIGIDIVAEGGKINVIIVNRGVPIPSEEISELFKKFRVLSTRPTFAEHSAGLGLFLAQELAKKLNAMITYTPLSDGSEFTCILSSDQADDHSSK